MFHFKLYEVLKKNNQN